MMIASMLRIKKGRSNRISTGRSGSVQVQLLRFARNNKSSFFSVGLATRATRWFCACRS